jgi:hypothetical protein
VTGSLSLVKGSLDGARMRRQVAAEPSVRRGVSWQAETRGGAVPWRAEKIRSNQSGKLPDSFFRMLKFSKEIECG